MSAQVGRLVSSCLLDDGVPLSLDVGKTIDKKRELTVQFAAAVIAVGTGLSFKKSR